MNYRLGIDVGGTNTDAVLLNDTGEVVAAFKNATTTPVLEGIERAVAEVISSSKIDPTLIKDAMLGTTHATNAIVQRKGLSSVGVVRISAPSGLAIPPFADWPADMVEAIDGHYRIVHGGYEYNGTPITATDRGEIRRAVEELLASGAQALAISGAFSLVNPEQELLAQEIARELDAKIPITLSHEIGSIGLIERENAAILNAAIRQLAERAYGSFEDVLSRHRITADLFITQNDGTLMAIEYAKRYPVLTIASGPTNSLRGAAYLSGERNAIVVDVGGTTTDVGVLKNAFPRESGSAVEIGGVRTNFRMPDLISIGLGGGSIIRTDPDNGIKIGPDSVGYRISESARSFGGSTLTATDIALCAGSAVIEGTTPPTDLDSDTISAATERIRALIEEVIDKTKTVAGEVVVVAVGGGSILVPETLAGARVVKKPPHFAVANAIGAAIAQVSGAVDGVFDVASRGREAVLAEVKAQAIQNAVNAGAKENTVEVVELEEIPLAYLPSNAVRVRAKAVGELA